MAVNGIFSRKTANGKTVYDIKMTITDPSTGERKQVMKRGFRTKKRGRGI